ncbi:MAG: hypothetical protein WBM14_00840 [Terracidiphilus sp.]
MSNGLCRRVLPFVLFCLGFSGAAAAHQRDASPLAVDETHATAALAGDEIQIHLPLTRPDEAQARASI